MQEEHKQSQSFKVNKLSNSEFNYLLELFNNTDTGRSIRRQNYDINESFTLAPKDSKLKDFIKTITGINQKIKSLHYVTYREGGSSLPHYDTHTEYTVIFLLENSKTGGQLKLKESGKWKTVPFNNPGEWFIFKGSEYMHRVTKVKKGTRKTLVCWFEKNKGII